MVSIDTLFCQPIKKHVNQQILRTMISTWTKETIDNGVYKLLQYVHYGKQNKTVIRELNRRTGEPIYIVKIIHYIN
jgi:hypothetical protein